MQYQWFSVCYILNFSQTFKVQTSPVSRVFSVDITDSGSQEVYSQLSDCLTFLRISKLTHGSNTIFFTTDSTNFTFDG